VPELERVTTPRLETFQKQLAVASAVGILSLAGAIESGAAPIDPAAHQSATTYYRYSSLKTQTVLNSIHRTVLPIDQERSIRPTAAFMKSSTAGFKTDCHIRASYRSYTVSPLGTAEQPCGYGIPTTQKSEFDQYQPAMNKLGQLARKYVGLPSGQPVESINGTRKKVTFIYDCMQDQTAVTAYPLVSRIAFTSLRRPTRTRRSKAAVTTC
jgi:hypothetical protein